MCLNQFSRLSRVSKIVNNVISVPNPSCMANGSSIWCFVWADVWEFALSWWDSPLHVIFSKQAAFCFDVFLPCLLDLARQLLAVLFQTHLHRSMIRPWVPCTNVHEPSCEHFLKLRVFNTNKNLFYCLMIVDVYHTNTQICLNLMVC